MFEDTLTFAKNAYVWPSALPCIDTQHLRSSENCRLAKNGLGLANRTGALRSIGVEAPNAFVTLRPFSKGGVDALDRGNVRVSMP